MSKISKEEKRVRDLLYLENMIMSRIHCDIEETLRGHGRPAAEIKSSLYYVIDELFEHMENAEEDKGRT